MPPNLKSPNAPWGPAKDSANFAPLGLSSDTVWPTGPAKIALLFRSWRPQTLYMRCLGLVCRAKAHALRGIGSLVGFHLTMPVLS